MMDDASLAQVLAAAPDRSTWLSANAGSGKTRVLIDRVARLLLQGTPPQRILCLTYTNAAASEMQNRLFRRLGAWAMMPADDLETALVALGATAADLAEARRLFARAIETPGGLRIQTIHSFCASLLRRFPLEARVAPRFTEIDERTRAHLIRDVVEDMASGEASGLVSALGGVFGEFGFFKTVSRLADLRRGLVPQDRAAIWAKVGLARNVTARDLVDAAFRGVQADWWQAVIARLDGSGTNDQRLAQKLRAIRLDAPDISGLAALEDALLTKSGPRMGLPSDGSPTKGLRQADPALFEPLLDLAQRVGDLRPQRQALQSAEDAAVLSDFAAAFLPRFEQAKARRGWLDFDDLIERAERLLTEPSVAAWVLFRLDGGIDHILVDEAQDTSPNQWRVIDLLIQEFTAGLGARDRDRTLFVVGDKKQSIYSFQGADVSGFDRRNDQFRLAFQTVGLPYENRELRHSFRSSPVILDLVDELFADRYPAAMGADVRHVAFYGQMPGRVELWPAIAADKAEAEGEWTDPVDLVSPRAASVLLAEAIASHIRQMVDIGAPVPLETGGRRAARPGDFLILVRRRSGVFQHLIRACKAVGLPVAGADRLKLSEELAVMDLLALLSVLATPEDDLSLATVLRSPLFGWTEAELFTLAHGRTGYLWEALRQVPSDTLRVISDLRDQADFLRPHDLLDRILTRHHGRIRLVTRLGDEVVEAIDALLAQALAYEQVEVPSLDGFLAWMQGEDSTIKRQMGEAGDRIRIMTVHGAKGLESEIVILPDTANKRPNYDGTVLLDAEGLPFPSGAKDDRPAHVTALIDERAAREEEESLRLLYVALTRARTHLIVAAAGTANEDSWHGRVAAAMDARGAVTDDDGRKILQSADWPAPCPPSAATSIPAELEPVPTWAQTPVAAASPAQRPLSPSALGGEKVLAGPILVEDSTDSGTARGTVLHLLLQHLPDLAPHRWPVVAASLVPDEDLRARLLPLVERMVGDATLAPIFGPDSLAEAAISGQLFGHPAEGSIDRLVVTAGGVLAVDFKSNLLVPDRPASTPESILRQMGAYAALLAQAYPDRPIRTAVLWTETGHLMPLDDDIVRAALQRATSDGGLPLDAAPSRP
jgi:ATP-dependent helicase/nuclease subunit A